MAKKKKTLKVTNEKGSSNKKPKHGTSNRDNYKKIMGVTEKDIKGKQIGHVKTKGGKKGFVPLTPNQNNPYNTSEHKVPANKFLPAKKNPQKKK